MSKKLSFAKIITFTVIFILSVVIVCLVINFNANKTNTNDVQEETIISDELLQEADLFLQFVSAEAQEVSFDAKVAIAAVIINRVRDPRYPNNIKDVILNSEFRSVMDSTIMDEVPNKDTFNAIISAFDGNDLSNGATFYYDKYLTSAEVIKKFDIFETTAIVEPFVFKKI